MPTTVRALQGDIIQLAVQAIVKAASASLPGSGSGGGGSARSLHRPSGFG